MWELYVLRFTFCWKPSLPPTSHTKCILYIITKVHLCRPGVLSSASSKISTFAAATAGKWGWCFTSCCLGSSPAAARLQLWLKGVGSMCSGGMDWQGNGKAASAWWWEWMRFSRSHREQLQTLPKISPAECGNNWLTVLLLILGISPCYFCLYTTERFIMELNSWAMSSSKVGKYICFLLDCFCCCASGPLVKKNQNTEFSALHETRYFVVH